MTVVLCRVSAPAPVSGNITLQITVSVTRDTRDPRDPRDTRDSLHSDEGVRLVAVRVGGGEAAAAEDADLEGAVLGVEGEAELHLAAVVRHDEAVLAILPTLSYNLHPPFIFICSAVISFHFSSARRVINIHLEGRLVQTNLKLLLHLRKDLDETHSSFCQQMVAGYILIWWRIINKIRHCQSRYLISTPT